MHKLKAMSTADDRRKSEEDVKMDKKTKAGLITAIFAVLFGAILGLARSEDKRYSYRVGKN